MIGRFLRNVQYVDEVIVRHLFQYRLGILKNTNNGFIVIPYCRVLSFKISKVFMESWSMRLSFVHFLPERGCGVGSLQKQGAKLFILDLKVHVVICIEIGDTISLIPGYNRLLKIIDNNFLLLLERKEAHSSIFYLQLEVPQQIVSLIQSSQLKHVNLCQINNYLLILLNIQLQLAGG